MSTEKLVLYIGSSQMTFEDISGSKTEELSNTEPVSTYRYPLSSLST